jgi:hypothetical protein
LAFGAEGVPPRLLVTNPLPEGEAVVDDVLPKQRGSVFGDMVLKVPEPFVRGHVKVPIGGQL